LQGLDWSPDGTKIAYAKKMPDRVAVFVYNIAEKTIKAHSFPNASEKYLVMKWNVDSRKLLVVRTTGLNASIYSIDETHQEEVLVENENTVIGLTWDHTNNAFYFNSMKEGNLVISKFNVKSNTLE